MKQIISRISKDTNPSNNVQKSKQEIANIVYELVKIEIEKYSEIVLSLIHI